MRRAFIGIGLLLALALASGVSWFIANKGATTAAPPVVICGQTLYSGAEGLFVYSPYPDAARPHWTGPLSEVNNLPIGGSPPLLVQLSNDCGHGTRFSIHPTGLVSIKQEIRASNRGAVAVRLVGVQPGKATLVVLSGRYRGWKLPLMVVA
jgi:hypothetical protein